MAFLANENELFAKIYRDVYSNFYRALVPILKSLDPDSTTATCNRRAKLITALIDGAPAQVTQGKSQQLLNDVTTIAVSIATGDRGRI